MTRHTMIAMALLSISVLGQEVQAENSVLMRALEDELQRSLLELQLEELERPYFIAYRVHEHKRQGASATFGSLLSSNQHHNRTLSVEVRVGDHPLDNTNFQSFSFGRSGMLWMFGGSVPLPLEDDYGELRRQIWLATDGVYKKALEDLAKKRALLQNRTRTEIIDDFTREDPAQTEDWQNEIEMDQVWAEGLVKKLSALSRQAPAVFTSSVTIQAVNTISYYVNSEGTFFRRVSPSLTLKALAATQAPDGMPVEDFVAVYGRSTSDLSSEAELMDRVGEMGTRLQTISAAPLVERFTGPVLFEGQAAAELFVQGFAPRLIGDRKMLSDNPYFDQSSPKENPFLDKVGIRVLPEFLSVTDDPTLSQWKKNTLTGHYKVDDDGIPSRRVSLVEKGVLNTLLTTRNPVRGIDRSSGHRRGSGAMPGNLVVKVEKGLKEKKLRKEFLKLVKRQKKEFGLIVRRMGSPSARSGNPYQQSFSAPGADQTVGQPALLAYKVYLDGREELVRNAEFVGIQASTFKDIIAVSKEVFSYNTHYSARTSAPFGNRGFTTGMIGMVVPAGILFEDITVKPPSGEILKPPVSRHPFFAESGSAQ